MAPPAAAAAAAAAEEQQQQPNYKTHVLKVSIHCEACKRKVVKILSKIEGVDSVDVDTRRNKVTFKSLVDAQTVIQKLKKHGKPAELLLEVSPSPRDRKPASETEKLPEPAKIAVESSSPSPSAEAGRGSPEAETVMAVDTSVPEAKETKPESLEPEKPEKANPKIDDKNIDNSEKSPESGEEEKSKKVEDSNKERNEVEFKEEHAPHRVFPLQPAYVTSYNMVQPSMSQSHSVPPSMTVSSQGHIYDDQYPYFLRYYDGPVEDHPNLIGYMHQPPIDPYNIIFSDENPNASCSLM